MGRLLQYRFPGEPAARPTPRRARPRRRRRLGGHAIGNLLLAALIELEDGDFEEAVREMNRVLAVRGRVVPATADAAHAPRAPRRRHRGRGPEPDRAARRGRPGVDRARRRPPDRRRRCAAIAEAEVIVIGPGSLFTSILPALLVPGIARRDRRLAARSSSSPATSRPSRARPPASTSRITSTRWSATAPAACPTSCSRTTGSTRRAPQRLAGRSRSGSAGRRPAATAPRLVLDDLVDPDNAHHHDPRGSRPPSCAPGRARAATAAGPRRPRRARPDRPRMAGTDRDLVAALRAELAAVDPSRACDRNAEIAGPRPRPRPRADGRPAHRPPGRATAERPAPSHRAGRRTLESRVARLGDGARSTAGSPGCAAGSSPAGR